MDLTLNQEQRVLQASIAEALGGLVPPELVRRVERKDAEAERRAVWAKLAELDYLGLSVPEASGGAGGSLLDLALLLEQAGRVAIPGPSVDVAVAVTALAESGERADVLGSLLDGSATACIGWSEPGSDRLEHFALGESPSGRLAGTKISLSFGDSARHLLAFGRSRSGEPALFLVDLDAPGAVRTDRATLAEDREVDVQLEDVGADEVWLLSDKPDRVGRWRDLLFVATAAYGVGLCHRLLEASLAHASAREQFGRAIGSYQAVQHRCVDQALVTEGARYLAYQAADLLARDRPAALEASMAHSYAAHALEASCRHAHQVYGAIGYSREDDLQLYTRRAKQLQVRLGGRPARDEEIAALMGC